MRDLAIRRRDNRLNNNDFDGNLVGLRVGTNDGNSGVFFTIDSGDASIISQVDDGITTYRRNDNANVVTNVGVQFEALVYSDGSDDGGGFRANNDTHIYAVGNRTINNTGTAHPTPAKPRESAIFCTNST